MKIKQKKVTQTQFEAECSCGHQAHISSMTLQGGRYSVVTDCPGCFRSLSMHGASLGSMRVSSDTPSTLFDREKAEERAAMMDAILGGAR